MFQFWDAVIRPLLVAFRPRTIVEIGLDEGCNTRNLLAFCRETGATLHAIDPAPRFDAAAWAEAQGVRCVVHRGLSLEVLPTLEPFEAVLVDGDHNWYTVASELSWIRRRAAEWGRPFPLTLVHDLGWPYGRRDMYYDPATVPAEFRQPHRQKGLLPGVSPLCEAGGMNGHLHNADHEGGPRNGVLTAVEDFLREADLPVELVTIPAHFGLGVLVDARLWAGDAERMRAVGELVLSPPLRRLVEGLEAERIAGLFRPPAPPPPQGGVISVGR